jgi:hypothetical protein
LTLVHTASAWSRRQCPSSSRSSRSSATSSCVNIIARCGNQEAVAKQRLGNGALAIDRQCRNQYIEIAEAQIFHKFRGNRLAQLDRQVRIGLAQFRNKQRQQIGRNRRNNAQPQTPSQNAALLRRQFLQRADFIEYPAYPRQKALSHIGEDNTAPGALEQCRAEALFHFSDLRRERRLGYARHFRRLAEVQRRGENIEIVHLANGKHDK